MKRRQFLTRSVTAGLGVCIGCATSSDSASTAAPVRSETRPAAPPPDLSSLPADYAESAMLIGVTPGGDREFSIRLARFPHERKGSLWMSVFDGPQGYAAVIDDLRLGRFRGATAADEENAEYRVDGPSSGSFQRIDRSGLLRASADFFALCHETPDPPPGPGGRRVRVTAEFAAWHPPVEVRPGRIETMGAVRAVINTPSGDFVVDAVGGWHEQIGSRPRFGPAFTYMKVFGDGIGLLALRRAGGATGYYYDGESTVRVTRFAIDNSGERRAFEVDVENGRTIRGFATVRRRQSVPIEGRRRPGATVIVETPAGQMTGILNDWRPE